MPDIEVANVPPAWEFVVVILVYVALKFSFPLPPKLDDFGICAPKILDGVFGLILG
jgi:hypothetical protein